MGYLFAPNFAEDTERLEKIIQEFSKKAFLTNATLIFLLDETFDAMNFHTRIWRSNFGGAVNFQFVLKSQVNLEQLFRQVDYYIIGKSAEEIFYIDLAIRHGVKIIGTRNLPAEIFQDISVAPEVENLKNNLYADFVKNIVEKFPPLEYEYFLMHDGLGEVLAFFYWFKEYRKHNHKKILTLCIHPARTELMQICPYVNEVIQIDAKVYNYIQIFLSQQFEIKNAYTAHNAPTTLQKYNEIPIYYREPAGNFFHLAEGRQHFLQIPPEIKFERYSIELPKESITKAKKIFEDLKLKKGKTVFLKVESNNEGSTANLYDFWKNLADRLVAKGYKVVISGNDFKIQGYANVLMTLLESVAFVGLCGNIVSVTTGFIETICSLNSADKIQVQIIHKDEKFNWQQNGSSIFGRQLFLKEIQYFGSDFADKHLETYYNWMRRICGENITYNPQVWGHTSEENKKLLERIISNIISSKQN